MSLLPTIGAVDQDTGFYKGVATQSLRFDRASDPYLNRTATLGNRKTWTFSTWLKRSGFPSAVQYIFGTNVSNNDATSANIHIGSDNTITVAPWANHFVKTTALLRDVGAWYHIVVDFDTTQAGTGNSTRVNIYINGVDQTLANGGATLSQNSEWAINLNQANTRIGDLYGDANELDGYLAETNFVDGLSLDASYFGETKNGVWIPKGPVVSDYGTNGFRLKYIGTGTSTSSGAVSSPTNIGDDSSGKNNHFAVSGLDTHDSNMPDSPENNFCTWNGLFRGGEQSSSITATSTLSNGNLQVSVPGNSYMGNNFRPISGKWYCEFRLKTQGSANGETDWGWFQATTYADATAHSAKANKWGVYFHGYFTDHIQLFDETTQLGSNINLNIVAGNVLQLALDIDNGKGWVGINNTWYRTNASDGTSTDVANGTNQTFTFTADEAQNLTWYVANGTSTDVYVANFGQDSTFGGDETATTNADANEIGAFHHAPPTGFLALCSANLSDDDLPISPTADTQAVNHMGTLTYTGNGSSRSITSGATDIGGEISFTPDWVWIKNINGTGVHGLFDSSRGVTKYLQTNSNGDEGTASGVTEFDSNEFSLGSAFNQDTLTFVAWNWKAGGDIADVSGNFIKDGVAFTPTQGTIDATSISVNTTAGFSIVTYTGDNASSATLGHGLGVVPAMIIVKMRNGTNHWAVYHQSLGNTKSAYLSLPQNPDTNISFWNNTSPTDEVFTIGTDNIVNASNTYVAYCFAEVEGYSKFGSYTGGGSSFPFVYTGFRPAWVMVKRTNVANNWMMSDSVRDSDNPVSQLLYANLPNAEYGIVHLDFLSNGFKVRTTNASWNASGGKYVYMAFAEAPFKYANAR